MERRKWRRRTDGGYAQEYGSHARDNQADRSRCGFSLKGSNGGQLETPTMNKIDYVNSELINNKCNSELINILNHCNVRKFDPEREGSLKPQVRLGESEIDWEENPRPAYR